MYYEERYENGKWYYKYMPNDPWQEFTEKMYKLKNTPELKDNKFEQVSSRAKLIQKAMHKSIEAAYDSGLNPNVNDYTTAFLLRKIAELEIKIDNLTSKQ